MCSNGYLNLNREWDLLITGKEFCPSKIAWSDVREIFLGYFSPFFSFSCFFSFLDRTFTHYFSKSVTYLLGTYNFVLFIHYIILFIFYFIFSHRILPFLLRDWLHGFLGLFTDTSKHIRFYFFLVFCYSLFSLVPCGRLSWLMSAFERTLTQHLVSHRVVSYFLTIRFVFSSLLLENRPTAMSAIPNLLISQRVKPIHVAELNRSG